MKYKLKRRSTKGTPVKENGTNLTFTSDMALVSSQVKTLLYIVGLKAEESFDTSMLTCVYQGTGKSTRR